MDWGNVADRKIRQAMERGEFDHLKGKGQPLVLRDDPFEDPAWRMANDLLEAGGFLPEWLQIDLEIRQATEAARAAVRRTLRWAEATRARLGERRDLEAEQERDFVLDEVRQARQRFVRAVRQINQAILVYNLKVPLDHFQRLMLNLEAELAKVGLD